MILGEPFEKNSYTGSEKLIDCEVWEYRTGENSACLRL